MVAAENHAHYSAAGSGGETRTLNPLINSHLQARLSHIVVSHRRPYTRNDAQPSPCSELSEAVPLRTPRDQNVSAATPPGGGVVQR